MINKIAEKKEAYYTSTVRASRPLDSVVGTGGGGIPEVGGCLLEDPAPQLNPQARAETSEVQY